MSADPNIFPRPTVVTDTFQREWRPAKVSCSCQIFGEHAFKRMINDDLIPKDSEYILDDFITFNKSNTTLQNSTQAYWEAAIGREWPNNIVTSTEP